MTVAPLPHRPQRQVHRLGNCQVGIDVMSYAIKQEVLDNRDSSCIGCGICVTVCPMDVLSFSAQAPQPGLVQIEQTKAA